VCRRLGIFENTLYGWKTTNKGKGVAEFRTMPRRIRSRSSSTSRRATVTDLQLEREKLETHLRSTVAQPSVILSLCA
jgi:hypothetical protein